MGNAVRHARAERVHIALVARDDELELRVTDDGIGFCTGAEHHVGVGLASMRARTGELGGRLGLSSGAAGDQRARHPPARRCTVRLIICDDHPVYRDGLRLMLTELGFEVVAEAATGEEAVELAAALAPTLVMMDLHLPGISGIEATRQITAADPTIGVLVLMMLDDDQAVFVALRAGARGYLLEGAPIDGVARAVEASLAVTRCWPPR